MVPSLRGLPVLTQIVLGRVFDYAYAVGRWGSSGTTFSNPLKAVFGKNDAVYVLCRGYEVVPNMPWNRASFGVRICKVAIGLEAGDEELIGEFSRFGDAEGQLIWPAGIALDSQENIYVTDEWMNRISVFDSSGNHLRTWGTAGEGDGEINRPSGIAIDGSGDVLIVDSMNHRVQRFTGDGAFLEKWGSFGDGDGELNTPWGIGQDSDGNVYVADHKNHRAQKFTPDGQFLANFGSYGDGRGQLNRPSDVDVDPDGDVYVCDWVNNRVQVYDPEGKYLTTFVGDAQELSKWGRLQVEANPDTARRRKEVGDLRVEWGFSMPTGVTFDAEKSRLMAVDNQRHRIQIYNKVRGYLEPQRNL